MVVMMVAPAFCVPLYHQLPNTTISTPSATCRDVWALSQPNMPSVIQMACNEKDFLILSRMRTFTGQSTLMVLFSHACW